jgi:hypothetical protein
VHVQGRSQRRNGYRTRSLGLRNAYQVLTAPQGSAQGEFMFITIAAILFIAWLLGLTAFHVAGGLIHLLLVVALISVVLHFVRGR